MNDIATLLKQSNNGIGNYGRAPQPEPKSGRKFSATPLEQFQYHHLTPAQARQLKAAVDGVQKWIAEAPQTAGLSLILCGSYGTGKTTMAQNAMSAFRVAMVACGDTEIRQADLIYKTIANHQMSQEARAVLEAQAAELLAGKKIGEVLQGSLKNATNTMLLVEQGLSLNYGNDKVVVVDDVGTEEIPFKSESMFFSTRQVRYGNLIDYCYREGKSVIVTSNIPLYHAVTRPDGKQFKEPNPELIEVMGGRAFDRLYQMANGYMFDLTGLPTYRPWMVTP